MGQLPSSRKRPAPPFYLTGIDYAGPFSIKWVNLHKPTLVKVYTALFICMVTNAVHLEVTEGMLAAAFIKVLEWFTNQFRNPRSLI